MRHSLPSNLSPFSSSSSSVLYLSAQHCPIFCPPFLYPFCRRQQGGRDGRLTFDLHIRRCSQKTLSIFAPSLLYKHALSAAHLVLAGSRGAAAVAGGARQKSEEGKPNVQKSAFIDETMGPPASSCSSPRQGQSATAAPFVSTLHLEKRCTKPLCARWGQDEFFVLFCLPPQPAMTSEARELPLFAFSFLSHPLISRQIKVSGWRVQEGSSLSFLSPIPKSKATSEKGIKLDLTLGERPTEKNALGPDRRCRSSFRESRSKILLLTSLPHFAAAVS